LNVKGTKNGPLRISIEIYPSNRVWDCLNSAIVFSCNKNTIKKIRKCVRVTSTVISGEYYAVSGY
jgi:hypothetical protein